jgi:hypothetical protein
MKRFILLAVIAFFAHGTLNAQTILKEKGGVILTKDSASQDYFVENITKDSIKIFVVNGAKRLEKLPDGSFAVSTTSHAKVEFMLPPKEKRSLKRIVCIHSTGLMIGSISTDESNLIKQTFYAANN